MISVKLRTDRALERLRRFSKALASQKNGGGSGPVAAAMKKWQSRVLLFLQERYVRASRGSGAWRRHAPSTVQRRGRGAPILIETGRLFKGLRAIDVARGIAVGYDKRSGKYPKGPTVYRVATYHQTGGPRLPQRKIIVEPDRATRKLMAKDMDRALDKLADST